MAKMTMHKELEMLRAEVEELRKHKELENAQEDKEISIKKQEQEKAEEEIQHKADEIMQSLESGKTDAKEALDSLVETIQKDYKNLSPTSAIVLFALGAAFGSALSSK